MGRVVTLKSERTSLFDERNYIMILNQVLDLFTKFAVIGGGLWAVWGVIIVAWWSA